MTGRVLLYQIAVTIAERNLLPEEHEVPFSNTFSRMQESGPSGACNS